ncbi:MAG: M48 family metallopeptidase [Chitinophagales bacterium]|nr:M48 family metallopeptidase [Chitinophagales bacterium]MDW8392846.1 M48 family metallopeptidase [Chitinophagales bacterium]
MNLLPESELTSMALTQYQDVLKSSKVITGTADAQMVQRVGVNISNAAKTLMEKIGQSKSIAGYKWEYALIESKEPNAWCLPGGKIAVYTGILPITKDETGLAVVMGHEVGHALARHGNERMSHGLLAQMGGIALAVALAEQPQATQELFSQAYGLGVSVGALLPYSRLQESEADKIGLVLMAAAGYDPNKAIDFWQRMKQATGSSEVPAFFSTHPSDDQRIAEIKKFLPEAMKYYTKK